MSAEQARTIEAQQKQIQMLNKLLSDIVAEGTKNTITAGVIQSGGVMKEILDAKKTASITRYKCVEAYVVPAELLRGWVR